MIFDKFLRLEDQIKKKQCLKEQSEEISKSRDSYVKETQENSLVLEKLQESMVASEQELEVVYKLFLDRFIDANYYQNQISNE